MIDVIPMDKVFIDYADMVVIGHPDVIRRFRAELQEAEKVAIDCNTER